jgi:hypothetical protein
MSSIKENNKIMGRSDKTVEFGRAVDPVPHIRDVLCELGNDEAMRYGRQTRLIIHRLRESIIDTNEEMKSLNRVREALERLHEHTRKDLKTNLRSNQTRLTRPVREKCMDAADRLLVAEKVHLDNLKKMLEAHLCLVKIQLQTLNAARTRLSNVHQERSRVTDLLCYAVPCTGQQKAFVRNLNFAPPSCTQHASAEQMEPCSTVKLFPVEPLGPFTNECDDALEDARVAREHSATLRQEAQVLLKRAEDIQKTAHETVNRAITQKMTETDNLRIHLDIAVTENRSAANRSQRYFNKTQHSYFQTQGPESSRNLLTHEKLDRPIISTFQRHPGTNVPETMEVIRAGDALLSALDVSGRNIGLLKLAQQKMEADRQDKVSAMNIDNSVLKLRRRRAPHRWVMGGVVEHSWF